MPTRPCIERNTMAAVRSTFTKPFGLTRLISFPRSLSDIDRSTAANDPRPSASFSARKNPQRIPANTPPVFPGLRPRIWPHLLRLVTKAMSDRLLARKARQTESDSASPRSQEEGLMLVLIHKECGGPALDESP